MNIIISCHIDTVFSYPYVHWRGKVIKGALDNFASAFASVLVMRELRENVRIEWTEDEEMYMDGARQLAKKEDQENTLFVVMEVTERGKKWPKHPYFTIENIHRIATKHIRVALSPLVGNFRIVKGGTESEAWLYRDMGFAALEVCVPVSGGLHSLEATATLEDMEITSSAVVLIINYFKDKTLREVVDSLE